MYNARVIVKINDREISFDHKADSWESAWDDLSLFLDIIFGDEPTGVKLSYFVVEQGWENYWQSNPFDFLEV